MVASSQKFCSFILLKEAELETDTGSSMNNENYYRHRMTFVI